MNRYEARFSPVILDPVRMEFVPAAFALFEEFDAMDDEEARKKAPIVQADFARREGPLCPFNYDPAKMGGGKMNSRVIGPLHIRVLHTWVYK